MGKWMQRVQRTATGAGEATPAETIAEALEPVEREAARERQKQAGIANLPTVSSGKFPELTDRGQTRDKVAAYVGDQNVSASTSPGQTNKRTKSPRTYQVGDLVHRVCGQRRMTTGPVRVTEVLWIDGRVRYATSDSCLCPPEWLEAP